MQSMHLATLQTGVVFPLVPPWAWIMIAIGAGLLLLLILYCCCRRCCCKKGKGSKGEKKGLKGAIDLQNVKNMGNSYREKVSLNHYGNGYK